MTPKQLLDLPNELFFNIFEYLSSIELLKTFGDLQSYRIQALLQSFISLVDISQEDVRWIDRYLSDALVQRRIVGLRLQDKQISCVSKYLSLSNVQSMEVISLDSNDQIREEDLLELRRYLKNLTIKILCSMKTKEISGGFFVRTNGVPYFSYSSRFFYPNNETFYDWIHLTHLSIKLATMSDIFIILHRLPNLEDLQANLHNSYSRHTRTTDGQNTTPCKTLRRLTFTGASNYSPLFIRFFAVYGSTIESLKLDIDFKYIQLNVSEFEDHLLNKMPLLSSLELLMYWRLPYDYDIDTTDIMDIKPFQTASWQKFKPMVYWHDITSGFHEICTLPYMYQHFSIFSNEFVSSCATNRPVSLCMENVRALSMACKEPWWTMKTFTFIQQTFPYITTLSIDSEMSEIDRSYYEAFPEKRFPDIFSDDFRSNITIQLQSVTKLSLSMEPSQYNKETLGCLFHLLPNLISIETNNYEFFCHYIQSSGHYIDSVLSSLTSIKLPSHTSRIDPFIIYRNTSDDEY